jgi:hypothetical protein
MWHCCSKEAVRKFCSIQCKNKYHVDLKRKNIKLKALEFMGNKCLICGYDKCSDALEFHHLDPTKKDFGISSDGNTRSWDIISAELKKCICVCNRCHREIHSGLINLQNHTYHF